MRNRAEIRAPARSGGRVLLDLTRGGRDVHLLAVGERKLVERLQIAQPRLHRPLIHVGHLFDRRGLGGLPGPRRRGAIDHVHRHGELLFPGLGYDVLFALDATHTFDRETPDGEIMTADELARATATSLHGEFATVVRTAD